LNSLKQVTETAENFRSGNVLAQFPVTAYFCRSLLQLFTGTKLRHSEMSWLMAILERNESEEKKRKMFSVFLCFLSNDRHNSSKKLFLWRYKLCRNLPP